MSQTPAPLTFDPIGILHSCFKEKFGIPRQAGLAATARGELELIGDYANMDAVRGLEDCSHIWVLFVFSEHVDRGWSPLVRPPRSKGKKKGVFATRSSFRPNPIGMSVIKLEGIENRNGRPVLLLSGIDMLDGTPVIDIKPYVPYSDSLSDALFSYAPDGEKQSLQVRFSERAEQMLSNLPQPDSFRQLITDVLCCDPRPVHMRKRNDPRVYGTRLEHSNVRWQINDNGVDVIAIEPANQPVRDLNR